MARTAGWTGWQRYAPLSVGLSFIFAMLIPSLAGSGSDGPPAILQMVWGASWIILGLAYLVPSARPAVGLNASPELTRSHS